MAERPISPAELERLIERARAFAADLNDGALRHDFIRSAFNWDRLALKIVALADGASPASGSFQAPDEPLQPTPQGSEGLEQRFFIDHGMIHDRVSGKHVCTDDLLQPNGTAECLALLLSFADRIEALEGERDSVSVSQSASALHGAPSGSEPSGPTIRNALRLALDFAEAEAEQRAEAGGSMSDYINEAEEVADTVRGALAEAEKLP